MPFLRPPTLGVPKTRVGELFCMAGGPFKKTQLQILASLATPIVVLFGTCQMSSHAYPSLPILCNNKERTLYFNCCLFLVRQLAASRRLPWRPVGPQPAAGRRPLLGGAPSLRRAAEAKPRPRDARVPLAPPAAAAAPIRGSRGRGPRPPRRAPRPRLAAGGGGDGGRGGRL